MKRYWLSLALVPFIVLSIGTYYIQAAAKLLPDFTLMKQEGDESIASKVFLSGAYGNDRADQMTIGSQGSDYVSEQPFLKRMTTVYWGSDEVRKLVEEHRQFMRGKRGPNSFYEDDNRLVYANVSSDLANTSQAHNFRLDVSILDKKSNRTSSFEAVIPNEKAYHQIFVYDVQAIGEELKVVTQNNNRNGGSSDIHLYSLNLQNKKAPTDQVLFAEPSGNDGIDTNIGVGFEASTTGPNRYFAAYAVQYKKIKETNGGNRTETMGGRLLVYDMQTGQEIKIESKEINDLLNSASGSREITISSQNGELLLAKQIAQGVTIVRYSIPEGKVTSIDVPTDAVMYSTFKDHLLYMLTVTNKNKKELPVVAVADATTGKIVYKGMVALRGAEADGSIELGKLTVYNLFVK